MKRTKQRGLFTIFGIASILICVLLVTSGNFTNKAKAGPIYSLYLPIVLVHPEADLSITINDGLLTYTPGGTTTFTVVVTNDGPADVTGAFFTVTKTGQISSWTVTCVPDHLAVCTHGPTSPGGSISDLVSIPAGKQVTYTIVAHISAGAVGNLVTTAYITNEGSTYDPNIANNWASETDGPPSIVAITDTPDPSVPGQTVVVGVTVIGAGIPAPSGTVAITGADINCTILLDAAGTGSCGVIFNTTGHKIIKAAYSGDGQYAPSSGTESHTVEKGSTTTIIIADTPDPSTPTQAVEVGFIVIGGGVTPTGTVAITGANINCSITLSGGTGSCHVVFNTIGVKTLTATYSGDSNYLTSLDTEPHTVKNASTTSITSDHPDPSKPGDMVTVNVTVSGAGAAPTGTVNITGADVNCSITLAGGSGSCDVQFLTAGAKLLTATYDASLDPNYAGSTGTASHTVNKGSISWLIFSATPDPSAPNESVLVTASINGAGVIPTGTIAISISGVPSTCTIALAAGTGSCSVAFPTAGEFTITGIYSGDGNYYESMITTPHSVQ